MESRSANRGWMYHPASCGSIHLRITNALKFDARAQQTERSLG